MFIPKHSGILKVTLPPYKKPVTLRTTSGIFFLPTLKVAAQSVGKWATLCLDFALSSREEEKRSYKCRQMSLDSHQNQSRNWWTSDFGCKPTRSQSPHLIKIIFPIQKSVSSQMGLLLWQLKHWTQLWQRCTKSVLQCLEQQHMHTESADFHPLPTTLPQSPGNTESPPSILWFIKMKFRKSAAYWLVGSVSPTIRANSYRPHGRSQTGTTSTLVWLHKRSSQRCSLQGERYKQGCIIYHGHSFVKTRAFHSIINFFAARQLTTDLFHYESPLTKYLFNIKIQKWTTDKSFMKMHRLLRAIKCSSIWSGTHFKRFARHSFQLVSCGRRRRCQGLKKPARCPLSPPPAK